MKETLPTAGEGFATSLQLKSSQQYWPTAHSFVPNVASHWQSVVVIEEESEGVHATHIPVYMWWL